MKIIVIGGTGTIGSAVVDALDEHEVVRVGHSRGDRRLDMESTDAIQALFSSLGTFDALVCAAGNAAFQPLADLEEGHYQRSLRGKLMGQVNLVRLGLPHVSDGGSFTLTSGILSQQPTPGSAAVSMVNAGVEAFARAAALELPRGVRINVVSPPWVAETLAAMGRDPGDGLPAAAVARSYVASVEGRSSGQVIQAQ